MKIMKIDTLKKWLTEKEIDICFINNPAHIAYLTGYESDPHERVLALIILKGQLTSFLFTPALEIEDAKQATQGLNVYGYLDHENPWELISKHIHEQTQETKNWAIEENFLTVERYRNIQKEFSQSIMKADVTEKIQQMMVIKSEDEIAKMIEAGKYADFAFEVGFKAIKEGATEQEIIAEIEYELKKKGIMKMSFSTLVLAGSHAASPHGTPGDRKIAKDELVLFDLGTVYEGYTSDATRTVSFGQPTEQMKEVHAIVLEAHMTALAAVKPGVTAGTLDKLARDVITDAGYGEYFNHRLGHGLGSTVHEYPSIMEGNDFVIEAGMCFSIEPGIYIPNEVGVRIEDCVYVTETGCEVLTHTPKELLIIE